MVIPRRKLASCSEAEAKILIAKYAALNVIDETNYYELNSQLYSLVCHNLENLIVQNGTLYNSNIQHLRILPDKFVLDFEETFHHH